MTVETVRRWRQSALDVIAMHGDGDSFAAQEALEGTKRLVWLCDSWLAQGEALAAAQQALQQIADSPTDIHSGDSNRKTLIARAALASLSSPTEPEHTCGDDISFDRSICFCGSMHYFCNECGAQTDPCSESP